MRRRWMRRGAPAVGLSVAMHLLLLASGNPWSAPSTSPPVIINDIELIERRSSARNAESPPPEAPHTARPRQPDTSRRTTPLLASSAVDIPMTTETGRVEEPEDPPSPEPRPLPEAVVDLPTIPTPRAAARRLVALETPRQPTEVALVTARTNALLEGSLSPRINDQSPMPELHYDGEGNLVHENGALVATIRPDGSVVFGRNRGARFEGLGKSPDPAEQEILDLHTRLPGVPLIVRRATEGDCALGSCEDKAGLGFTIRPNSDLNDAILRAKGEDPLAAKKRRFLRLTKELRDHLSAQYRKQTLARSKLRAGRHLERLWSDSSLDFATKRRIIFQLWDECEEPEGSDDDREEAKAGQRSRDHILGFVRKNLPLGELEAYTQGELRRLNSARTSQQLFSPYE